jgi:DNA processing protein
VSDICVQCARRAWLLGALSAPLDFRARDLSRFWGVLELPDPELIEAIGGRRRAELRCAYAAWEPKSTERKSGVHTICPHMGLYPATLQGERLAPHMLGVHGGVERLRSMLGETVVAIVGSRRASDYGMETARALGHDLAACGLTVASGLGEGIPAAVHAGALEVEAATLTVLAGGTERCSPAWCQGLYRRIVTRGCAISELPSSPRAPRWGEPARARTLALLAQLVIVVEAEQRPSELACAQVALRLGRPLAAIPGRVSSSTSEGTNSLLLGGAQLVRGSQDALDLLYGVGTRHPPRTAEPSPAIEPNLQAVLDQVGRGVDTVAKLTSPDLASQDVAQALIGLELQGLLVRGDGGRYLPSASASTR